MIGSRHVLALITARGGSKGLPGKNIRPAAGRPLIAWTIEAARASEYVDRTVLSSDDGTIMDVAQSCGCEVPFTRPAALSTDTASSIDVVMHALDALPGSDMVVLLQPTSPLRTAGDIDEACRTLERTGAPACVSVCAVQQSPYWMYRTDEGGRLVPLLDSPHRTQQRQRLPAVYMPNGAVYVADVAWLRRTGSFLTPETVAYVMPAERSLDIDTAADFDIFAKAVERG